MAETDLMNKEAVAGFRLVEAMQRVKKGCGVCGHVFFLGRYNVFVHIPNMLAKCVDEIDCVNDAPRLLQSSEAACPYSKPFLSGFTSVDYIIIPPSHL